MVVAKILKLPGLSKKVCLTITEHDIKLGRRNESSRCPVARVLHRLGYTGINVWVTRTSFVDPNTDKWVSKDNPPELQEFIQKFDTKQEVEPATFYI